MSTSKWNSIWIFIKHLKIRGLKTAELDRLGNVLTTEGVPVAKYSCISCMDQPQFYFTVSKSRLLLKLHVPWSFFPTNSESLSGNLDFFNFKSCFPSIKFKKTQFCGWNRPIQNVCQQFSPIEYFEPSNCKMLAKMLNIFVKIYAVYESLIMISKHRVYKIGKSYVLSSNISSKTS